MPGFEWTSEGLRFVDNAIIMDDYGGDPTTVTGKAILYSKSKNAYIKDGDGNVIQVTDNGELLVPDPSLIVDGTSNVTVESTNGDVSLDTAGTERMRVTAAGAITLESNYSGGVGTYGIDLLTTAAAGGLRARTTGSGAPIVLDAADAINLTAGDSSTWSLTDLDLDTTGVITINSADDTAATYGIRISADGAINSLGVRVEASTDVVIAADNIASLIGSASSGYGTVVSAPNSDAIINADGKVDVFTNSTQRLSISTAGVWDVDGSTLQADFTSGLTIVGASGGADKSSLYLADDFAELSSVGLATTEILSVTGIRLSSGGFTKILSSASQVLDITSSAWDIDGTTLTEDFTGAMTTTVGGTYTIDANGPADYNYVIDALHGIALGSAEDVKTAIYLLASASTGEGIRISSGTKVRIDTGNSSDLDINVAGAIDADVTGSMDWNAGGYFRAYSGSTQRLDIGSTGDWDVDGAAFDADFTGLVNIASSADPLSNYAIVLRTTGSTQTIGIHLHSATSIINDADGGSFAFRTNSTDRYRVDNAGATSISASTFVVGATSTLNLNAQGSAAITTTGSEVDITLDSDDDIFLNADDYIYLQTGATPTTRMSISAAGSFDVNCAAWDLDATSTINMLSTYAPVAAADAIYLGTSDDNANIKLQSGGVVYIHSGTGKTIFIRPEGTSGQGIAMTSTANYIYQQVRMPDLTSAAVSDLGISGGIVYIDTSSRAWKKDIEDIDNMVSPTERIFDLRPVRYRRKDSFTPSPEEMTDEERAIETAMIEEENERYFFGFIAEEVQEIMPEFVMKDLKTGIVQSLKYNWMVVPIIVELDKARDRIASLEARVAQLEA